MSKTMLEVRELTTKYITRFHEDVYAAVSYTHLDNLQGRRELVRYAYDRGHRQIAFIHGGDTPVTRDRLASRCV